MSSLPVLMISMTMLFVEMARDPAHGAQQRDGAEANADVTVTHAPKFGVRPMRGKIIQRLGRHKQIAQTFHDQRAFAGLFEMMEAEAIEIDRRDSETFASRLGERQRGHGDIHARDGVHEDGEFEGLRMRGEQAGEPAAE